MSEYLVTIEGQNLLVDVEGELGKFGFVRVEQVEASNATLAARRALTEVQTDPTIAQKIRNESGDSPAMTVKDVVRADQDAEARKIAGTTVWFPMDARE